MAQAQVVTGMVFPSAGVRILIPLVVATFMEEASGEAMLHLSDYNIGMSVGGVLSTAFAMADDKGQPKFSARDVLLDTYATSAVMFAQDPMRVLMNNVRRDLPKVVGAAAQSKLMRMIVHQLTQHMPEAKSSRYDHAMLQASLQRNFGDSLMRDSAKSNLVLAHDMDRGEPALFGHIDNKAFPSEGLELSVVPAEQARDHDHMPLHSNVPVTDGLLAATAIPGLIGYRCVDSLQHHFMDAGSFGMPALVGVVEDMHERATNKIVRERPAPVPEPVAAPAPEPGFWQRFVSGLTPQRSPVPLVPRPANDGPAEEPVVTRILMLGIGGEKGLPFDRTGADGLVAEVGNIVRAAGDLVTGSSLVALRRRFNRLSMETTGRTALQIIDAPIMGAKDGPSLDIKDGRPENLQRLLAFGRQVAVDHREVIRDEIMLRMETLAARGLRSPEQVEAVAKRLEAVATPEGAERVCDTFLAMTRDTPRLLAERGIAPALEGAGTRASQGWFSGLPALMRS